VHTYYGTIEALKGITIDVRDGEIVTLIGANGAGKSTMLRSINGLNRPRRGTIRFQGQEITNRPAHEIVKLGIAQSPEGRRLFPRMSVLENLLVAQHNALMRASGLSVLGLLGAASFRRAERAAIDHARYWLDRAGLTEAADLDAGNLPYGGQRRLEIARAMCTRPALLCLDEPAAGLNHTESRDLNRMLQFIRDEHQVGVLLIEHDMSVVMGISDKVVVLDYGRKIAEGTPEAVRHSPEVIRAYLGEEEGDALPPEVLADLAKHGGAPQ
jgi:branched-chain amino acid transport system ATP-binding protein